MIRKGLTVGMIVLFVCISVFPADGSIMVESFDGRTLYVGGDGSNNYTKIQEAIDDAEDGDIVFVFDDSSPYYENVVVHKSIDLIEEN